VKKYSALVAASIGVAGLAASASAATMTLSLQYVGSTTATNGSGLVVSPNLGSDTAKQTSAWRHVFDVFVTFNDPAGAPDEAFRFVNFDLVPTGSWVPTTVNGTDGTTANKWIANNPSSTQTLSPTFTGNGDGGTGGDNLAIFVSQTVSSDAYANLVGEPGADPVAPRPRSVVLSMSSLRLCSLASRSRLPRRSRRVAPLVSTMPMIRTTRISPHSLVALAARRLRLPMLFQNRLPLASSRWAV